MGKHCWNLIQNSKIWASIWPSEQDWSQAEGITLLRLSGLGCLLVSVAYSLPLLFSRICPKAVSLFFSSPSGVSKSLGAEPILSWQKGRTQNILSSGSFFYPWLRTSLVKMEHGYKPWLGTMLIQYRISNATLYHSVAAALGHCVCGWIRIRGDCTYQWWTNPRDSMNEMLSYREGKCNYNII